MTKTGTVRITYEEDLFRTVQLQEIVRVSVPDGASAVDVAIEEWGKKNPERNVQNAEFVGWDLSEVAGG
jgi:hypothetical protein